MAKGIFEYTDYKKFLREALQPDASKRSGNRVKLAEALGCEPAFISRVLNTDKTHLSQEHGMLTNRFFSHDVHEAHYFMLLLNFGKSGSRLVADYYLKQIEEVQARRELISERIQVKDKLGEADQARYYSSWHCAAIHTLIANPAFRTPRAISTRLRIAPAVVSECLEFLVGKGLAKREGNEIVSTKLRTHLKKDSPMLHQHHANWRMKAIQSLDEPETDDLHFSGPISLGKKEVEEIRALLLDFLTRSEKIIGPAPDESIYCLGLDWFKL